MTISEPMTVATDYLLALFAGGWGIALWRDGGRRGERAPRLFAASFAVLAFGAALGGTAHGLAETLDRAVLAVVWRATTVSLGVAGYCFLAGAVVATLGGITAAALLALGGIKLALYILWTTSHHEFYWVILEYGTSLVAVAGLMAWPARRAGGSQAVGARWVLGGILLSAVGAAVQGGGLAPHPSFNHNDLYHVIQIGALFLFTRGGLELSDAGSVSRPAASAGC